MAPFYRTHRCKSLVGPAIDLSFRISVRALFSNPIPKSEIRNPMSIIYRKVVRDIWHNKTRTLMVVLSTAVGIFALGLVMTLSGLMTGRMTAEWEASQPAHVVLYTDSFSEGMVDALARTRGVADIEPSINATIQWKHPGETGWRNAYVEARQDYEHQRQNLVTLVSGVWPRTERNAILVERQSSLYFNIPVGGVIVIKTAHIEREMKVAGVARSLTVFPPQFCPRSRKSRRSWRATNSSGGSSGSVFRSARRRSMTPNGTLSRTILTRSCSSWA